jgi:hypothetical protein
MRISRKVSQLVRVTLPSAPSQAPSSFRIVRSLSHLGPYLTFLQHTTTADLNHSIPSLGRRVCARWEARRLSSYYRRVRLQQRYRCTFRLSRLRRLCSHFSHQFRLMATSLYPASLEGTTVLLSRLCARFRAFQIVAHRLKWSR